MGGGGGMAPQAPHSYATGVSTKSYQPVECFVVRVPVPVHVLYILTHLDELYIELIMVIT